jgi:hypothetical protein
MCSSTSLSSTVGFMSMSASLRNGSKLSVLLSCGLLSLRFILLLCSGAKGQLTRQSTLQQRAQHHH